MARTKSDIVTGACRELGHVPVEQGVDSGYYAIVEGVFENVLSELQANEVVAWGEETTPNECANALEVYIAQKAANRAAADKDVRDYLIGLGRTPYMNLVAVAGKRWDGASSTNVDRF